MYVSNVPRTRRSSVAGRLFRVFGRARYYPQTKSPPPLSRAQGGGYIEVLLWPGRLQVTVHVTPWSSIPYAGSWKDKEIGTSYPGQPWDYHGCSWLSSCFPHGVDDAQNRTPHLGVMPGCELSNTCLHVATGKSLS